MPGPDGASGRRLLAGGTGDIVATAVSEALSRRLDQKVVVDYRPGGSVSALLVTAVLVFMWRLPHRGEALAGWAPPLALVSAWAGLLAAAISGGLWLLPYPDRWLAAVLLFFDPASIACGTLVLWIHRGVLARPPAVSPAHPGVRGHRAGTGGGRPGIRVRDGAQNAVHAGGVVKRGRRTDGKRCSAARVPRIPRRVRHPPDL